MKTAFAVLVAIVFMLLGWLTLSGLLVGLMYLAAQAREGGGLIYVLNTLFTWIISPGYGGFLATYITPRLFKTIDPSTIATAFISVVVTVVIVLSLFWIAIKHHTDSSWWQLVLSILQTVSIVVGAKIGKTSYAANIA